MGKRGLYLSIDPVLRAAEMKGKVLRRWGVSRAGERAAIVLRPPRVGETEVSDPA